MKHIVRLAAVFAVCAAMLCLSACYSAPVVIIDPVDDPADNPTDVPATVTTQAPVANTQLTWQNLMALHEYPLPWSSLEPFDHTKTGDNTATFTVVYEQEKSCTLTVTIDSATQNLSEATLSYGDVSVSLLEESTLCMMPVMQAMAKD